MNLFEIAAENDSHVLDTFEQVKRASNGPASVLDNFAAFIYDTSRVAINMRAPVLADIVAGGRYQNVYEWANERASLSSRPAADILREKLGQYYSRRVRFDDSFENGRRFRYGMLTIGGAGAERFAPFCAVLTAGFVEEGTPIAYLKFDSLNTYMPSEDKLNEAALWQDVATHSHRHYLATLKHVAQLAKSNQDDWPLIVCSSDDYIEAIFLKEVDSSWIDKVRVSEAEYRRLFDLALTDYTRRHDDATQALMGDFVQILRAERDGLFTLERV